MSVKLSDMIDSLADLKRQKKNLEFEVKEIDRSISIAEADIIAAMDTDGLIESKNTLGKVTISESTYPHVEQWETFGDYILDNRALYLLERRPAVLAYRELLTSGKAVPGVLPFTKRKLTFKET